ncbi:MAG TPA: DUF3014 domain-containing protein [Xanthomonadales bacterium]|nr:DUF3014 domain-containing protein [Xanthomonadales bacterium]
MRNLIIILVVLLLAGAAYYFVTMREPAQDIEAPPSIVPVQAEPEPVVEEPPPTVPPVDQGLEGEEVLEVEVETAPLPRLSASDPMVMESLTEVAGEEAVKQYLVPDNVIARIVATVDNLTGKQVSPNLMPVQTLETPFEANVDFDPPEVMTNALGDPLEQYLVDPVSYERYRPYVELIESMSTDELIDTYQQQAPLFQEAYQDLGYPEGDFTTRLLEVIDVMLAAPEPAEPVRLIKPEAYFLFADPELEALPAGQKLMIRMGNDNAQRVKAKLREVRAAIASQ